MSGCTANAASTHVINDFRSSADDNVNFMSFALFRYFNTPINFVSSCSLGVDTLVVRKAIGKRMSGLALFDTYRSFAMTL